jgi:RimJ/RimL family protein N-acetyltransferase
MHPPRPPEPTLDCGPCVLRAWRRDDLDALLRHADNPNVARGLRDRFPSPYTRADGERFLASLPSLRHEWRFAIEVGGEAAGGLGFHPGEDVHRHSAEVGYWLGEAHWGRGIVPAALRAVVPLAMAQLHLLRVHAGVYSNNPTSMRALERAGFEREGVQRCAALKHGALLDVIVFARVRRSLEEPIA